MEDNYITNSPFKIFNLLIWPASIIGLLLFVCAIYVPSFTGTFMLDDNHTLSALNKLGGVTSMENLAHFISDGVGRLGRPISMLSFLLDDQYFPGDPEKYRYTNLMFHLLCGLFIFLLVLKIFDLINVEQSRRELLAFLVIALWLLHPLNLSTTAYIVQRMSQLMTLFTLMGLTSYVYGRCIVATREKLGLIYMTAALIPLGILAVMSKENGILICVYILALELTVLRQSYRPSWFKYWTGIFVILPLVLLFLYLTYKFKSHYAIYAFRDFTLAERLLTESRILVSYLYQIIIPPSSGTGLFHDDIEISTSLLSPLSTLASILLIISLIFMAVKHMKNQPVLSLSIFWFLGGHVLESTVIPLELYFEHRNYLPMVGPLFAIVYYCYVLAFKGQHQSLRVVIQTIPVLLILLSSLFTYQSAIIWGKPEILYRVWHEEHPDSLRASTMYAQMFEKHGNYSKAVELLEQTYQKHPDTIALRLYMLIISCQNNIPPGFSINDIIHASQHAVYRDALPIISKNLVATVQQSNCKYVTRDDLISILTAVENIDRLRGSAKAEILVLLSDLYVSRGQLSPAIEALDRAFTAQRLPTIALRQAELLSSAGLYDDALRYIDIAKSVDNRRAFLQASYIQLINAMENHIHKQMGKQPLAFG